MAERTWIHAFTDGRDVSPTSAVRDLAELPDDRIATIAGRYYAMDRDKRWERTQLALDAILARHGAPTARPGRRARAGELRRRRHRRVHRAGLARRPAARSTRRRTRAIFFNFRPDRARQLREKLGELGRRPDDDDAVPGRLRLPRRLPGAERRHGAGRGARRARRPPAPHGRDREVRPRHLLLQRRPRGRVRRARRACSSRRRATSRATTTSRRCRPSSSPTASSRRSATATRSRSSTSRTRTWSATPASSRPSSQAVETADACLGRVVEAVDGARRRLPRHRRPRQRREDARGRRRQPAHGAHDEPGPLDRDRKGTQAAGRWRAVRPRARRFWRFSVLPSPYK